MGDSFENVPQLYRLPPDRMKLSELIGLRPVRSIHVQKNLKTLQMDPRGQHGRVSQLNWTLCSSVISNDRSLKILP